MKKTMTQTIHIKEDCSLNLIAKRDTKKDIDIIIEKDSDIIIDITAEPNSSLNIETKMRDKKTKIKRQADVKEFANLKLIDRFRDCEIDMISTANLTGRGAESKHISFLHGKNIKADISSVHIRPDTRSDIKTRSALSKGERCKIKGLVKIEKEAKGSEGFQNMGILMLDKDAIADADPNLEIDNNEVRCSHGVAITRIDEEKIFYMKSRGIKEKKAKEMIIESFMEWDEG